MIKNECEIVKDLIPNYVEDLISKDTREFMENHISSCNNCKKILEEIKKEKNTEEKKESKIEKGQIDYLKKYNRKSGKKRAARGRKRLKTHISCAKLEKLRKTGDEAEGCWARRHARHRVLGNFRGECPIIGREGGKKHGKAENQNSFESV